MNKNKKYTEIMKQLNYKPIVSVLLRLCGVVNCKFMVKKMNKLLLFTLIILVMTFLMYVLGREYTPLILVPMCFLWIYANN